MEKVLIVWFIDKKAGQVNGRSVLRLDTAQHPNTFVDDRNVLNVKGSYQSVGDTQWYYFPLLNVERWTIQNGTAA